jgi:hypothetical protein
MAALLSCPRIVSICNVAAHNRGSHGASCFRQKILFQANLRAEWRHERLAVLNKIKATSDAPKMF